MSAAEQAQGVEETRESHALKILAQLEARKNRLRQENMGLVFPEPEKLAAIAARREESGAKARALEEAQQAAEARLPALEEERREAQQALQERTREAAQLEAALKALEAQQASSTTTRAWPTGRNRTRSIAPSGSGRRSTSRRAGTRRWKRRWACA